MNQSAPHFLHPVSLEDFFSNYWEQQPLHIHRNSGETKSYIDLAGIESLLSSQPVFFPGVQLTQSGRTIDVASYADEDNRILPLRLFEHYAQGATIVLSQAQKLFMPLTDLCREVTRTMQMRCQTNVYLSPPGNQGFNAHYDTHDVFIMQVGGSKTFNFYPSSIELPCPEERFDHSTLTAAQIDESIRLEAGDTLYIPRGIVHDAVADQSAPSIHITLGVYPVLIKDLLQEAVQMMSESDIRLRRSRDSFYRSIKQNRDDELQAILGSLMHDIQEWVDDPATVRRVQARFDDELSVSAPQDCQGLFLRGNTGKTSDEQLPAFRALRLRQELLINYEFHEGVVKIRTFGLLLEFSDPIARFMKKLLNSGELNKEELDGLQVEQRDAAIKRLLQANLVDLID